MAGRTGAVALAAAVTTVLAACGSSGGTHAAAGGGAADAAGVKGTVVVFAATSLTDTFNRLGSEFEKAHPGVTVKFNYNGSSTLATQINQGSSADVFASASPTNMKTVTDQHMAEGTPKTFARNQGEIMVGAGNPKHIASVSDLAQQGTKVVVCAPAVPCGALANGIFKNAGVTVHPVSQEQNVGGVVTKVSLGEADAGITYVTDVKANGTKTKGVPIPADQNEITSYPITEVKNAPNTKGATAFIDFVLGSEGQHVLDSYGFLPPTA